MYYCFVKQNLNGLCENDSLMIQSNFAKQLGVFCCFDLSNNKVIDCNDQIINVKRKNVFLRATCDIASVVSKNLIQQGACLVESCDDIKAIEYWDLLRLTSREIVCINLSVILNGIFPNYIENFLNKYPIVFIKSRSKGFSAQIKSSKLLQRDKEILNFFKRQSKLVGDEFILAKWLNIRCDSLGKKESRHFVINSIIINSSRMVHTVKHAVSRSQIEKAGVFVDYISKNKNFPKNYVIDIGDFEDEGKVFTDIVEINPITSAFCYVNNSIFDTEALEPEIMEFQQKTGMGAEYCYDALRHPECYLKRRLSNVCYEYANSEYYSFM